ncbi:MAG: M48 family metallopeptidase [Verrucomicrobia bacterium]|nr:M48 family metallopeptidase [Verrucomicrobiota bacterium]
MLGAPTDHESFSGSTLGLKAGNLRIIPRSSTRARRLILRFLNADTLELVLPEGVRLKQAADFLVKHATWIREARARWAAGSEEHERGLPSRIHLHAIQETWQVQGTFAEGSKLRLAERPPGRLLELHGSIDRRHLWSALLQTWLKRKAKVVLVPWLERIASRTGFDYRRVTVRLQRSRWGSCSSRQHINLNARLLLVAPELVDYLLIHELCHTRELNHSRRFWRLVERHCPEYKNLDRKLNVASRELPDWSQFQIYR